MTGWGKEWPTIDWKEPTEKIDRPGIDWPSSATEVNAIWQNAQTDAWNKLKLSGDVIVTETKIENGEITIRDITKEFNKIPTHDPYTNPGAYLYYECKCGQRLDPHIKRFAELNNAAMKAGWKIRWGANSYVPHCVECGKDVE